MAQLETHRVGVKQAVQAAMDFVRDMYSGEKISNLGLEEVRLDDDTWYVTVGFSRPWDYPKLQPPSLLEVARTNLGSRTESSPDRDYKVVKVDQSTGEVIGMEMRDE